MWRPPLGALAKQAGARSGGRDLDPELLAQLPHQGALREARPPRPCRPGNSHRPAIARPGARCWSSTRPSSSASAAATTVIVGIFSTRASLGRVSLTVCPLSAPDQCQGWGRCDLCKRFSGTERGATAVEYGLILAMIFLAMIVGVAAVGTTTSEHVEQRFRGRPQQQLRPASVQLRHVKGGPAAAFSCVPSDLHNSRQAALTVRQRLRRRTDRIRRNERGPTTRTRKCSIIRKLIRNSKGATAIEYGLIAALIAVAAIAAMQGLGTSLQTTFNNVSSGMNS